MQEETLTPNISVWLPASRFILAHALPHPALERGRPRRGSGALCQFDPDRAGGQRTLGGGEPARPHLAHREVVVLRCLIVEHGDRRSADCDTEVVRRAKIEAVSSIPFYVEGQMSALTEVEQ